MSEKLSNRVGERDAELQRAFNDARDAQLEAIRAQQYARERIAHFRALQQEAVEHQAVAA